MATFLNEFLLWDYIVMLVLLLVVPLAIGVFFTITGASKSTPEEYLLGGRNMPVFPVAVSTMMTFTSSILFVGLPVEMYTQGTEFFVTLIGVAFGLMVAVFFFVPLLYPLGITSVFEYLERRYMSSILRIWSTLLMIIYQIILSSTTLYAAAATFEAVTEFPLWVSLILVGVVATTYTSMGGIKAVVWSDTFQALLILAGLLAIFIQGILEVGGFTDVWEINEDWDRINFFTLDPDPRLRHSVYTTVIGGGLGALGLGFNQLFAQRYLSLSCQGRARGTVLLTLLVTILFVALACFTGLIVFAYYVTSGCDPISLGLVDNAEQLIPYVVMEILAIPAIPGILMAALFAGTLSLLASSMNALAAVTWEDNLLKQSLNHVAEAKQTLVIKLLVVIYGLILTGVAYVVNIVDMEFVEAALTFLSPIAGTLAGLFLLGAFFPCANKFGAMLGSLVSLGFALWQSLGSYIHDIDNVYLDPIVPSGLCGVNSTSLPEVTGTTVEVTPVNETAWNDNFVDSYYSLSYLWVNAGAMVICVVVGLIFSLCTFCLSRDDVPLIYQIPVISRLCCCLPNSCLFFLDCCRDFDNAVLEGDDIIEMRFRVIGDEEQGGVAEPGDHYTSYDLKQLPLPEAKVVEPEPEPKPKPESEPESEPEPTVIDAVDGASDNSSDSGVEGITVVSVKYLDV